MPIALGALHAVHVIQADVEPDRLLAWRCAGRARSNRGRSSRRRRGVANSCLASPQSAIVRLPAICRTLFSRLRRFVLARTALLTTTLVANWLHDARGFRSRSARTARLIRLDGAAIRVSHWTAERIGDVLWGRRPKVRRSAIGPAAGECWRAEARDGRGFNAKFRSGHGVSSFWGKFLGRTVQWAGWQPARRLSGVLQYIITFAISANVLSPEL